MDLPVGSHCPCNLSSPSPHVPLYSAGRRWATRTSPSRFRFAASATATCVSSLCASKIFFPAHQFSRCAVPHGAVGVGPGSLPVHPRPRSRRCRELRWPQSLEIQGWGLCRRRLHGGQLQDDRRGHRVQPVRAGQGAVLQGWANRDIQLKIPRRDGDVRRLHRSDCGQRGVRFAPATWPRHGARGAAFGASPRCSCNGRLSVAISAPCIASCFTRVFIFPSFLFSPPLVRGDHDV